jgi:hypothetical protein
LIGAKGPVSSFAGSATLAKLVGASRPIARSTSGSLIEVDLDRQLLLVVANGQLHWAMDTSTGRVPGTTPRGTHKVYRQIDGYHQAPVGVLYRPKYVFEGVAVHAYPTVPASAWAYEVAHRRRARRLNAPIVADDEQLDYGPPSVLGIGRLAALALSVLVIFVICTIGFWVVVFVANDAFCLVGGC